MDDSNVVGGRQSTGEFHAIVQHLPQPHRAFTEALAQSLPVEQLGHDVGRAVVLADVKDRNDVWMVQGGSGLRFLFKAAKTLGVPRPVLGKYLDRHVALQRGVARAIDFTHPAGTQGAENFVAIQFRTWGQWHR